MTEKDSQKMVTILYTNYKGRTSLRRIIPMSLEYASSQWHKEEQWLMKAYDVDKKAERDFAVKDIKAWYPGS